jgi:metallo-beta-lactamase family protein
VCSSDLAEWLKHRRPIGGEIFLVHGEEAALAGLAARASTFHPADRIVIPRLDAAWELTPDGARPIDEGRFIPRIDPARAGHRDWHNDYQSLLLDLQESLAAAADDRARAVVLRRIRRALEE